MAEGLMPPNPDRYAHRDSDLSGLKPDSSRTTNEFSNVCARRSEATVAAETAKAAVNIAILRKFIRCRG
jgi:hypothetical protein